MAFAIANKNGILCEAPRNGWQSKNRPHNKICQKYKNSGHTAKWQSSYGFNELHTPTNPFRNNKFV